MSLILKELIKEVRSFAIGEGVTPTAITGLSCFRISKPGRRSKKTWDASICFVMQGTKEIILEDQVYQCRPGDYIITPLALPVVSRVHDLTEEAPFLAIKIPFDMDLLLRTSQMFARNDPDLSSDRPLFIDRASDEMLDVALRLVKLFKSPDEAKALGELRLREILYYLLKGPNGASLRQVVSSASVAHRMFRLIYEIKENLSETIDVNQLAKKAVMSRSAFFHSFKNATGMSPIQYQKRLRLLEAQRLLVEESETAEGSAFRVGYKSPSQFSREYTRMFGRPPKEDAALLQRKPNSGKINLP